MAKRRRGNSGQRFTGTGAAVTAPTPAVVANAAPVQNGLAAAIGCPIGIGGGLGGFTFPGGQGQGSPVSSSNTLFDDMRWYLVTNFRQALSQAYVEIGLVQTITDVPVDDALRGGLIVKSKQ